ncbi:NAD+ synthase [Campylobacter sp. RM16192]|uniref:NAD+ synthase n=1 Tax=Campylobacter sp. RM16192 TaxID=1660080 RepID=UPI0014525C84|nr:NAD+ synthase [Campylobacter sp. RM16192]QCD52858.1 NAD synthetase, NH3-dependent [Campylobacter sp. RM16192]
MVADYSRIILKLQDFLNNYLKISGASNFLVGVSGGLDSAAVLTICALSKPINTYALIMPTKFSNKKNLDDALKLCKKLDVRYKIIDIEPILQSFKNQISDDLSKMRIGNLAARVRMCLLYDYSASINALVIGTSNKSERMLGYGTIYGDMAYALNPIGELFKTEIFELAKFLNIDDSIINKAPSADLWENQSDEADIGYSYNQIDMVLKEICLNKNKEDLRKIFDEQLVDTVFSRMRANEFKLKMPPIADLNIN